MIKLTDILNEVDSKNAIVSLKGDYPGSKVYQAVGDGKTSVKAQQTNKTWDDGAPMTNKLFCSRMYCRDAHLELKRQAAEDIGEKNTNWFRNTN